MLETVEEGLRTSVELGGIADFLKSEAALDEMRAFFDKVNTLAEAVVINQYECARSISIWSNNNVLIYQPDPAILIAAIYIW